MRIIQIIYYLFHYAEVSDISFHASTRMPILLYTRLHFDSYYTYVLMHTHFQSISPVPESHMASSQCFPSIKLLCYAFEITPRFYETRFWMFLEKQNLIVFLYSIHSLHTQYFINKTQLLFKAHRTCTPRTCSLKLKFLQSPLHVLA